MRHTIVAASGGAAPAGGNYIAFSSASLNARNDVVFDAFLGGPSITGVFVGDGTRTSTIALGGNQDPAAANFAFVENPYIAANGNVLFDANVIGDTFISDGGTTLPLVRDGDQAPGGGTLTVRQARAVNNHGAIAYLARVIGATATQGIFRTDLRQTVTIARDDIAVPTGGRFISFRDPDINNRGQVAFEAEMSGGSADFGIFRGEGGNLTSVFVANQSAPGGGAFEDFGNPVINARSGSGRCLIEEQPWQRRYVCRRWDECSRDCAPGTTCSEGRQLCLQARIPATGNAQ
jgi:hypothetical protein